jgi:hypothetical protein
MPSTAKHVSNRGNEDGIEMLETHMLTQIIWNQGSWIPQNADNLCKDYYKFAGLYQQHKLFLSVLFNNAVNCEGYTVLVTDE